MPTKWKTKRKQISQTATLRRPRSTLLCCAEIKNRWRGQQKEKLHTQEKRMAMDERKQKALHDFRAKLLQHKEVNDRVRSSTCCAIKSTFLSSTTIASPSQPCWLNHMLIVLQLPWHCSVREDFKTQKRAYDKSEDDLKALQSVGQIIGEVLRQLDDEKCTPPPRLSNWAVYTSFRPKRQIFVSLS
jgi:hypothetical protein